MPRDTFVRLAEEKRRRFLDAAWAEFSRVPFAEVSINRIVRGAGIPRGSFYQYFTDREELFRYLLDQVGQWYGRTYQALVRAKGGDLFRAHLAAFDEVLDEGPHRLPYAAGFLRILRMNPDLDLQKIMDRRPGRQILRAVYDELDLTGFCSREQHFVEQVFVLSGMALASAVMDVLIDPDHRETIREELEERMEIIRRGCLAVPAGT